MASPPPRPPPPPKPPLSSGFSSSSISSDPSTFATYVSTVITPVTRTVTSPPTSLSSSSATSATSGYPAIPTYSLPSHIDDDGFWDNLENGARAGIGLAIAIGVIIVVVMSVWFCCGCCGLRKKRKERHEGSGATDDNTQQPVPVPLNTMNSAPVPHPANDAPPEYEEAVPHRHQHIAGGARHGREDEEEGVISDGKTPLSEIPFEDVVLDHSPSEGSSRSFNERHHGLGGDTRGHTNT